MWLQGVCLRYSASAALASPAGSSLCLLTFDSEVRLQGQVQAIHGWVHSIQRVGGSADKSQPDSRVGWWLPGCCGPPVVHRSTRPAGVDVERCLCLPSRCSAPPSLSSSVLAWIRMSVSAERAVSVGSSHLLLRRCTHLRSMIISCCFMSLC